jgi:preprotein translocase subunit SecA
VFAGTALRQRNAAAIAPYAERDVRPLAGFDRSAAILLGRLRLLSQPARAGESVAASVRRLAQNYEGLSEAKLTETAQSMRARLLCEGASGRTARDAFALVHAVVERTLGLRYHPVQIAGGLGMLKRQTVEMATGEGKTITALLPAAVFALSGAPVHIVTVNDYLARRDAELSEPVFRALGLSVGLIQERMPPDERRLAYLADVTYVTNKELGFDYLRDRIAAGWLRGASRRAVAALFEPAAAQGMTLRGLQVAIVDEADSVLVDEARTPLIISADKGEADVETATYVALEAAMSLHLREHFVLDPTERSVHLTPRGETLAESATASLTGLFRRRQGRLQLVTQALNALHLYERDKHYLVVDGAIQIIDEYTGRTMPDRTWEAGLHQLVEVKEGVEMTSARTTLARITYQQFFNRYLHLCGMTGTASEVAGELFAVYGLRVWRIPTNRPVIRHYLGARFLPDTRAKWHAVAERAAALSRSGRPVLVGTQSVEASETLSTLLTDLGITHTVLNARQNAEEAAIIARAGELGQVTVATNMAGRGTDIKLTREVAVSGGLHVILTGFHDSQRVDRQLFGRSGRQGDPGSCEAIVSLDDELFRRFAPGLARAGGPLIVRNRGVSRIAGTVLRRRAQAAAGRLYADIRRQQEELDRRAETGLAFAGRE